MTVMSSRLSQSHANTHCSRGHVHPPWPTTGTLHIAKCESQCGFCQKETKTAANLRKHVAIHIKNEGLNLTIAEGSSGRGRLEMPSTELEKRQSPTVSSTALTSTFSAPNTLLSMSKGPSHVQPMAPAYYSQYQHTPTSTNSTPSPIPGIAHLSHPQPYPSNPMDFASLQGHHTLHGPPTPITLSPLQRFQSKPHVQPALGAPPNPQSHQLPQLRDSRSPQPDLFHSLRNNLATKIAWTAIPSAEGTQILEMCKRNSFIDSHEDYSNTYDMSSSSSSLTSSRKGSLVHSLMSSSPPLRPSAHSMNSFAVPEDQRDGGMPGHVPCYHRRVLFDEEWQAHMRDVHGVFLLWPDTWMKRIEVLDLDAFGGDIGVCNDVIMDG